jgi:Flp pilus assembly protein TadG
MRPRRFLNREPATQRKVKASHARPATTGRTAGSLTAEMVVLTPLLAALAMLAVMVGRLETASEEVTDAARAAAQAASLWPTVGQAYTAAEETASYVLHGDHMTCSPYGVTLDAGDFSPGGHLGVTVSCAVSYAQVALPGLPGSRTLTETVTAPLETYRSYG